MKHFKKQIIAIAASMLLSFSAYAQSSTGMPHDTHAPSSGWKVEGSVGIVSDYILAGRTMSDNNPSLSLYINAAYDWFFVEAKMNTIQSKFFDKFQAEWIPAVGVSYTFGEVDTYLTYRLYRYTGGTLWTGERASSWNADEVGIGASWKGLYAEIAPLVWVKEGSRNTLFLLGYGHEFGNLGLDAFVIFQHYNSPSKTRFTNFQLTASYNFKGLEPYIGVTFGGKEADNSSIDNRVFVGIRYNF